jgi:hypothetical protein
MPTQPTFESVLADVLKLPHAAKQRLSDWLHGHLAAAEPGPAPAPAQTKPKTAAKKTAPEAKDATTTS